MRSSGFELLEQVPLAPRTTLEVGGAAAYLAELESVDALRSALAWAHERALPTEVLGGGSNLLVRDEGYPGLVLAMRTSGRELSRQGAAVRVRAAAGESWDELVAFTVAQGLAGLECLSGIPGLVGASPVQNVGAYGQDVSQTLVAVDLLDRRTLAPARWTNADCQFAYRDSRLKREAGRYVVTAVEFELREGGRPRLSYQELERAFSDRTPGLREVREAVLALRRGKSMVYSKDDPNHRSAGSFFTNPVVSAAQAAEVAERARRLGVSGAMPSWAQGDGRVKLAAGWLIERAGFVKGQRQGPVGLSSAHALALVNHGGATAAQLLAFAAEVVAKVSDCFGVTLEREPVLL